MVGLRTEDLYYYEHRRKDERRLVRWRTDPLDEKDLRLEDPATAEIFQYLTAQKVAELRNTAQSLTRYYRPPAPGAPPAPPTPAKVPPRKKPR
jgi:hypothetical protein